MIPPDVAAQLRPSAPDAAATNKAQHQTQPVAPAQRITDVLSNLVPGQRIFAEIQAMLPNGSYRATVAQRDVTLALPFSAKPGDSLELEVTESDGKLTLAFVANRGEAAAKPADVSVATSLSRTGQLIGDLMQGIEGEGKRAPAAPLNANQAIVPAMPKDAADLAPVLKQALTQSGMFYEAHQAKWVAGQLPTANLLEEPQGKFSTPAQAHTVNLAGNEKTPESTGRQEAALPVHAARAETAPASTSTAGIPREITPLVQQQLDGLANQNFAWQGQIWPGQQMWWEIGENPEDRKMVGDEMPARWHTRLKMKLPQLGDIDATLRLQPGGELAIRVVTDSPESEARLQAGLDALRKQMEAAGLNIRQALISHEQSEA